MKLKTTLPGLLILVVILLGSIAQAAQPQARAYFAPDGDLKKAVISHINGAKQSIHVLSYYFSEPDVAKALAAAARRGVKVEAIFDAKVESKDKNPFLARELKDAGATVLLDGNHKTMHNKVIIYDGKTVQTGSYNLRKKVDKKNAENVLFITSEDVAAQYLKDFQTHKSHSQPYQGLSPSK